MTSIVVCLTVALLTDAVESADILPYRDGDIKVVWLFHKTTLDGEYRINGQLMENFEISYHGKIDLSRGSADSSMIAAYYAMIGMTERNSPIGIVWYRQTTNPIDLSQLTKQIRASNKTFENFLAARAIVTTWENVTFRNANAEGKKKRNTFQLSVVTDTDGADLFAVFSYEKLQWTTYMGEPPTDLSTGLGGKDSATAYFKLSGQSYHFLLGSMHADQLQLVKRSNTGTTGRWIYRISTWSGASAKILPYRDGDIKLRYSTSFTPDGQWRMIGTFKVERHGQIKFSSGSAQNPSVPKDSAIAAYLAVNIITDGTVWYRQTTNQQDLSQLTSQIRASSKVFENFSAARAIISTWENITFKNANAEGKKKRNTFQLSIVTDAEGADLFAVFSYEKLQWSTYGLNADPSTGTGGDTASTYIKLPGQSYHSLLGSKHADPLQLARLSNTGIAGRWIYRINCPTTLFDPKSEDPELGGKSSATHLRPTSLGELLIVITVLTCAVGGVTSSYSL